MLIRCMTFSIMFGLVLGLALSFAEDRVLINETQTPTSKDGTPTVLVPAGPFPMGFHQEIVMGDGMSIHVTRFSWIRS